MQEINSLESFNEKEGKSQQLEFPFQVNQDDLEYIYGVDDED